MKKLIAIFLVFAVLTSPVIADSDGEDIEEEEVPELDEEEKEEKEEYEEEMGEREVEITQDGNHTIEISSNTENETNGTETEEEFKIEIQSEDSLEIGLERESETETETTEVENSSEMKVRFDSIVEYEDTNNNSAYDEGEEVNRKELTSFQSLNHSTFNNSQNQTVNQITSTSTDGVFQVDFYAVGDFAKVGSETVTPTSVKYDIVVNSYNYTQNNTDLAVIKDIESEKETEKEDEDEESEEEVISFDTGDLKTFLSWKKTAQVDGNTVQVNSTELETEEGEKKVALSYGRGDSIVHDPQIGFSPSTSDTDTIIGKTISLPQRIINWILGLFR